MTLAAVVYPAGAHPGGWRMPGSMASLPMDVAGHMRVAATAEQGKFDCLIFMDPDDSSRAVRPECDPYGLRLDPMQLLPALAMRTSRIGLLASFAVASAVPYHAARRVATLDHISGGRAGMHLVPDATPHRTDEFAAVCAGLWESWDADAIVRDKPSGRYFDPAKVRVLNHKGRHFAVRGPLNVARCPQGRPVVSVSATADTDRDLLARVADLVVVEHRDMAQAKAYAIDIKSRAVRCGRTADAVKVVMPIVPVVGENDALGSARLRQLDQLAAGCAASRTPAWLCVAGGPATIADFMQAWFEANAVDGFALAFPYFHEAHDDFVELVVPELQRRGLFRRDYEGTMLSDHLGLPPRVPAVGAAGRRANEVRPCHDA